MKVSEHAKMIYLIRRRVGVSHDELVMHWFKNHMPAVIRSNERAKEQGRDGAVKYIAQLFISRHQEHSSWDGMAQLWFNNPIRPFNQPAGTNPSDTFQEKAEPYGSWATREYVIRDGSERLSTEPLTLNDPYPSTRSGFFRMNYLVAVKAGTDLDEFYDHWLNVHVPNVNSCLDEAGGFRYVVSHSIYREQAPYAGMAELYFENEEGSKIFQSTIKPDGMEKWIDSAAMDVMRGHTEMVGIP